MGDLRQFAREIRLVGEAIAGNADKLVRKTALAIDTTVVMATPVKTGRARANWRVQVGSANTESLPAPSSPAAGVSAALAEAQSAVAAYQGEGEIHLTNNLPYIGRLNAGHSQQAPAGFVELAVQQAAQVVKKADLVNGDFEFTVQQTEPVVPGDPERLRTAGLRAAQVTEEEEGR